MRRYILISTISFLVFSIFCILILYILIKAKENQVKKHFLKQVNISDVRAKMLILENTYIKSLFEGKLQGKDKVIEYLQGIRNVIDASNDMTNLHFSRISMEDVFELIKQAQQLDEASMRLFFEYTALSNRLYKICHPVKHTINAIKKNTELRILLFILKVIVELSALMHKKELPEIGDKIKQKTTIFEKAVNIFKKAWDIFTPFGSTGAQNKNEQYKNLPTISTNISAC